ncbi:MAG TPA: hypothetical protein VJY15_13295 [Candidatus Acidoferrum sp.]|nr:hypothetical protein [Candidatus Acidoferrum sp.]
MPEAKDVIIGILGASGALAGLLLVFGGFIFAQAASFPSSTDDKITARYTKAGRLAIFPFWGFLITTLLSLAWLLHPNSCLFFSCVSLFVLLVIGTGIYGTLMSYRYL